MSKCEYLQSSLSHKELLTKPWLKHLKCLWIETLLQYSSTLLLRYSITGFKELVVSKKGLMKTDPSKVLQLETSESCITFFLINNNNNNNQHASSHSEQNIKLHGNWFSWLGGSRWWTDRHRREEERTFRKLYHDILFIASREHMGRRGGGNEGGCGGWGMTADRWMRQGQAGDLTQGRQEEAVHYRVCVYLWYLCLLLWSSLPSPRQENVCKILLPDILKLPCFCFLSFNWRIKGKRNRKFVGRCKIKDVCWNWWRTVDPGEVLKRMDLSQPYHTCSQKDIHEKKKKIHLDMQQPYTIKKLSVQLESKVLLYSYPALKCPFRLLKRQWPT